MLEIVEYEDLDLLKKQNYENFSILFLENW
jgi:hypothetical protein